jgi:hypothetical protein
MALVRLVAFYCAGLTVSIATLPWAPEWLAALPPPTAEEHLSLPKYVSTDALESPETALDLAAMEQLRLIHTLVEYLKFARGDSNTSCWRCMSRPASSLVGDPAAGMTSKKNAGGSFTSHPSRAWMGPPQHLVPMLRFKNRRGRLQMELDEGEVVFEFGAVLPGAGGGDGAVEGVGVG